MTSKHFRPSPSYLNKMRVVMILIALATWLGMAALAWGLSFDSDIGGQGARIIMYVSTGLTLLWLIPALLVSGPYARSLRYEIENDEVIVRVGILTNSVKHVPYRTVTNITVKRDPFDRWLFGLGSLNIQTAGMSGTTGAEERLVGLADVGAVYDLVAAELRRFRGAMSPTAAGLDQEIMEASPPIAAGVELAAILGEVQAIREALEKA